MSINNLTHFETKELLNSPADGFYHSQPITSEKVETLLDPKCVPQKHNFYPQGFGINFNECSFHSVLWVLKTSSQFPTRFHCTLCCYASTRGYHPPLPGSKLNLNPVQLRTFNCFRCESACQFMRVAFRSCCQSKGTSHTRSICKAAVNVRAFVFSALVLTSFCWGSPLAS